MKILTSAKINLNLKIHDGLQDNFHKIESDVIPIGIFDEIVIKESQKFCCNLIFPAKFDNLRKIAK